MATFNLDFPNHLPVLNKSISGYGNWWITMETIHSEQAVPGTHTSFSCHSEQIHRSLAYEILRMCNRFNQIFLLCILFNRNQANKLDAALS